MAAPRLRIAHLSDTHALEHRPPSSGGSALRIRYLGGGRPIDARARARKLGRALLAAQCGGATHFVISGDLTECGTPGQFEAFADTLAESGISPERITLVPGNHDAYDAKDAWARALAGPLRPYGKTSAGVAGAVVDLGEVVLLPVSTARHQAITRSSGEIDPSAAEALERRLSDPGILRRTVAFVQHHPPYAHARKVVQWIDGLIGHARLMTMLDRHPHVQVLHGHLHRLVDRLVWGGDRGGAIPGLAVRAERHRVLGAPAVVEDPDGAPRVRLYEPRWGLLEEVVASLKGLDPKRPSARTIPR